jgi:hypothetical protein
VERRSEVLAKSGSLLAEKRTISWAKVACNRTKEQSERAHSVDQTKFNRDQIRNIAQKLDITKEGAGFVDAQSNAPKMEELARPSGTPWNWSSGPQLLSRSSLPQHSCQPSLRPMQAPQVWVAEGSSSSSPSQCSHLFVTRQIHLPLPPASPVKTLPAV